jgi:hypothetical protein
MNLPKSVIVISPETVTGAATVTGRLDTLGYDFAVIDVMATTTNSATNNFSILTLAEGDTTSSYATVKTADTDWTVANMSTTLDQVIAQFRVDMRGRKRYLKLTASPLTNHTVWAHATLFRGDKEPVVAADANVGALIDV